MKRLIALLPIVAVLMMIPFKVAGAAELGSSGSSQGDASLPVASNVVGVSGVISGVGIAGRLLFSRRQK